MWSIVPAFPLHSSDYFRQGLAIMSERHGDHDQIEDPGQSVRSVGAVVQSIGILI